jgi:hypothetical protein
MGSLPATWKPQGLQPKIVIKDWDDTVAYTYEHPQIAGSPTQDFDLYGWSLNQGIGTQFGNLILNIHDHDNQLVDLTSSAQPSSIKNEYTVEVSLGKNSTDLNLWFVGRIREGGITRLPQQRFLDLFATGLGTLLADRNTRINHQQLRESGDPLALDSTDTDAKVSEIAKRMISDSENYLNSSIAVLPFTTTGVADIDVKLANFDKRPATPVSNAFTELANSAGAIWGVDYSSNDLWMRYAGSESSDILITNDLTSSLTTNWDVDKLCFSLSRARKYTDSTVGYAYAYLHAIGALHPVADVDQTSSNATLDLSSNYHAIEFTPDQDNVWIIAPYLQKTGTPSESLHVCLIGSTLTGDPAPDTLIQRRIIRPEELQDIPGSGKYFMLEFNNINIAPKTKLFIYFEKYGDAVNNIDLDYQTGSGEYWTSSNGTTWNDPPVGPLGKLVGAAKMRIYGAKKTQISYENVSLSKLFGNQTYPKETVIPMDGIHQDTAIDILTSVSNTRSRQRRIYDSIKISPPTDPLELGKTVRYIDGFGSSNFDITADITSYSMTANIYDLKSNGVHEITVNIEEPFVT